MVLRAFLLKNNPSNKEVIMTKKLCDIIKSFPTERQERIDQRAQEIMREQSLYEAMLERDQISVIQAAIRYKKGNEEIILTLPRPARHHHIFREFNPVEKYLLNGYEETQGFLTTFGFADREEALGYAQNKNQIIKKHPSEDELYSEDMW